MPKPGDAITEAELAQNWRNRVLSRCSAMEEPYGMTRLTQAIEAEQQMRDLQQQLEVIRGESDDLERQLQGRIDKLQQERHELDHLTGDISSLDGKYSASKQEALVTNTVESDLVVADLRALAANLVAEFHNDPPAATPGER